MRQVGEHLEHSIRKKVDAKIEHRMIEGKPKALKVESKGDKWDILAAKTEPYFEKDGQFNFELYSKDQTMLQRYP